MLKYIWKFSLFRYRIYAEDKNFLRNCWKKIFHDFQEPPILSGKLIESMRRLTADVMKFNSNISMLSKGTTKSTYSAKLAFLFVAWKMETKTFCKIEGKDCFTTFKNLEYLVESWFDKYDVLQKISSCSILIKLSKGFSIYQKVLILQCLVYYIISHMVEKDCFKTFKNLEYFLESWFYQFVVRQKILLSSILIKISKGFTKKYLFCQFSLDNWSINNEYKNF